VHPDGRAYNLMSPTLEVLRARYRSGEDRPEPLEPGRPGEAAARERITSNVFKAGHRSRPDGDELAPPHLDRNPNTGGVIANGGRGRYGRSS
jgi:predicted acyl esterase